MQTTLNQRDTDPFWDWVAPRYARKPISDLSAYEDKLARVRGLLRPTDRVLEIGCGTGGTALKLAPGVAEMTATDVSRRMIEFAHARQGGETATNVSFRQGAADDDLDRAVRPGDPRGRTGGDVRFRVGTPRAGPGRSAEVGRWDSRRRSSPPRRPSSDTSCRRRSRPGGRSSTRPP